MRKKSVLVIVLLFLVSFASIYYLTLPNTYLPETTEPLPDYDVVILSPSEIKGINSEITDEEHKESTIKINNEIIEPNKTKEDLMIELSKSKHQYFILQFIGPIKQKWKQTLKRLNIEFYDYIPDFSYKIKAHPKQIPEILKLDFVANIVEYRPELKIIKDTRDKIDTMSSFGEINLFVETFDDIDNVEIEKYAKEYVKDSSNSYIVKIKKSNIGKLLESENINVIEEMKPINIFNDFTADIIEVDPTAEILNLNGTGQIVGVIDSGIDTGVDSLTTEGDIHLDLDNRIVNISIIGNNVCQLSSRTCTDPDDINGHGTHVSGSVLANGTQSSGQYRGIAYAAALSFFAAGDDDGTTSVYISNLASSMIQTLYNDGARIETNSWGSGTTEYSSALARNFDRFMWNNKDILILNSAGNSGSSLQTIRDPGTAKNILTVGASNSNRSGSGYGTDPEAIPTFSSRGPANDGRIKPDVVAPGTNIVSTRSSVGVTSCTSAISGNNNYSTCSGTSMATPLTAGYAALIRQNFIDNLGDDEVQGSLIKAMIINGASYIGAYPIPSNHTGWGRINMTNTLIPTYPIYFKYIDNRTGFSSSGQYDIYTFDIINDTAPIKITLVWTDYESTASAETNLVNDLDLIVTSPNGTVYYGNTAPPNHNSSQDRLNTVEQLILNSSTAEVENGTYTINISAFSISQTDQDYSLVISGPLNVSPTTAKFDGGTTDFGTVQQLYNTTGHTLENSSYGNITWNDYAYFADMNFDKNVIFSSNSLYVNSSGLHTTLNSNVTIYLINLSYAAPMPIKDDSSCVYPDCQLVSSSEGKIEFYAVGFSGADTYSLSSAENTSLDIWDMLDTGKSNVQNVVSEPMYQDQEIYFYANYTNFTSSLPIINANCNITFNHTATIAVMTYNSTSAYYEYNRTFADADNFIYNISCSAPNFYQRNSSNTTSISDINAIYPWQPTNHSIVLNDNITVTLSWNSTKDAGSYGIFYDNNVTLLWEFNDTSTPNITGITDLNYTDNTINATAQRYYKIVAENSSRINASNVTLGVFKKELPATTGNPNSGIEQIIISVPLNVTNLTLANLISTSSELASNNDMIYTYNTTSDKSTASQPESVQFFSGLGWYGDFDKFNLNQGYIFKPVASAYNITFVGFVPTTNSTITINSSTNIAGNTSSGTKAELNVIGLNTAQQKCDLDTIFYGATDGDSIFRYNTVTAAYETVSYDGTNWSGDFNCINAGEGYEMRIVGSSYNVNYER
ncbi:MAG: S8 family serine peptidase [Candidatus Woesearchaeota archaeon]